MEVVSLAVEGGSYMVEWLPKFIARRVFSAEKLSTQITLSLRDVAPINIIGTPPVLSLWFRLNNQSSLDVRVDRISIEAWFGQPIAVMSNVVPFDVLRRSEATDICVHAVLGRDVADYARAVRKANGRIYLYVTAVCKTSVRDFMLKTTIERDSADAKFDGLRDLDDVSLQ